MQYIIESDFEYNGFRCLTTFTQDGCRAGYVGLPHGNPLYGCILHRRSLLHKFEVYHGIMYSVDGHANNSPLDCDLWWLGFDCWTRNDSVDIAKRESLFGVSPELRRLESLGLLKGQVRDVTFVQQQCMHLVDQIIDYCINAVKII